MSAPAAQQRAVTVRPATRADVPAIAALLIQLYAAELPGALRGPRQGQQQLLEFTLQAREGQGLWGRYIACDAGGSILGTASIHLPGEPQYERAPSGTVSQAVRLIGVPATARLLLTVARSMVPVGQPALPQAAFIHSVAVEEARRGRGVGSALMADLERRAAAKGVEVAALQVLASNLPARRLYRQLGYGEIWVTPRWAELLTWRSYIMRKLLAPVDLIHP